MLENITSSSINALGDFKNYYYYYYYYYEKISLLMLGSNYHFYENYMFFYSCKKICLSRISIPVLLLQPLSFHP